MKRNREYKKGGPFRDASLFIIACEGAKREANYFKLFNEKSTRIRVVVREGSNSGEDPGKSAPNWLLDWAICKVEEFGLGENDSLWFVSDVDRWTQKSLRILNEECKKNKNWYIVLSNPCFEVWLFLHISDISKSTSCTCKELKNEIHKLTRGNTHVETLIKNIDIAVIRAKKADHDPSHYLPSQKITKVYILAEKLIEIVKNPA
jgi:hypothetical protein